MQLQRSPEHFLTFVGNDFHYIVYYGAMRVPQTARLVIQKGVDIYKFEFLALHWHFETWNCDDTLYFFPHHCRNLNVCMYLYSILINV